MNVNERPLEVEPLELIAEQGHGEGWEPVVVEVFGHRSHAGFMREEERFGTKLLRIDVPVNGDKDRPKWETHWYGGAAIFSLRSTDSASVFAINKRSYVEPGRLTYRPDDDDEDNDPGEVDDDRPF